jgi:hypothetical protein
MWKWNSPRMICRRRGLLSARNNFEFSSLFYAPFPFVSVAKGGMKPHCQPAKIAPQNALRKVRRNARTVERFAYRAALQSAPSVRGAAKAVGTAGTRGTGIVWRVGLPAALVRSESDPGAGDATCYRCLPFGGRCRSAADPVNGSLFGRLMSVCGPQGAC